MGWLEEGRAKRKAQDAEQRELAEIRRNSGRGVPGSTNPDDFVLVGWTAAYLGGWDGDLAANVQVRFNCEGVELLKPGSFYGGPEPVGSIAWGEVEWVEITDATREKSRVAATVAFGVAGLGTKGSDDWTELLIHLKDQRIVAFRLDGTSATRLKALVSPTVAAARVPLERATSQSSAMPLVEELERLAALHAAGSLTDQEFSEFKAQLRR